MTMKKLASEMVIVLCLYAPAMAAMYTIDNPAEKIRNPADKMYNPATQIKNPAANMYNPATRMDAANPLSPPTQPVAEPATAEATKQRAKQGKVLLSPAVPQKNYYFKTVKEYVTAAKKAFAQDDYLEFLALTEDALRRIRAGTLQASKKTRQQLAKYKAFGYGLLEKNEE
jgi:hypothetical protein